MNELGSELNWDWQKWIVNRVHATANAIARFENQDVQARSGEFACSRKSGCPSPDHERVDARHALIVASGADEELANGIAALDRAEQFDVHRLA